jgi:mannose-6-phosphate isomerase-like protein (cupin superfamily)
MYQRNPGGLLMIVSRRELAALPSMLGASPSQTPEGKNVSSNVYLFDKLTLRHTDVVDYRAIVDGKTIDGCKFSVHESALSLGNEPHPPHHHNGEEMFLMIDGTLEVTINGKASKISKGSVAFIGSGDQHGIRNVGTTPAKYFVIELGPQR